MKPSQSGADLLVQTLQLAGVDKIASLSGNHIMPVYDALRDSAITLYHVRHEGAAVHMAEAYARLSGKLGVALVTGGPGHANAIGALYTARQSETPLLLLSGHAPLRELGRGAFQEMDQAGLAAPLCKASWMVASPASLAQDVARAIVLAQSGRPGPVHLSLPSDILEAQAATAPRAPVLSPPTGLSDTALDALRTALDRARRPLFLLPPSLCTPAGQAMTAKLRAQGCICLPMESPRGVNDPALGAVQALLAAADCIVSLGKSVDFTLKFGNLGAADWIVIDPDSAMLARARAALGERLRLGLVADIPAVLGQLAQIKPQNAPGWAERAHAALTCRAAPPPATALNSFSMCQALAAFMRGLEDPVFICDGGEIGQWAQAAIQAPARIINGVAGAIGSALPFALGAKAAAPARPVLAVMGDGTFGFHMAEFETALRHNLPFVAVIGNDARWNAEYQIQLRDYGGTRTHGCELLPGTRYDAAVAALGGHGELVTREEEIAPALARAFASNKPACVNIIIAGLAAPRLQ